MFTYIIIIIMKLLTFLSSRKLSAMYFDVFPSDKKVLMSWVNDDPWRKEILLFGFSVYILPHILYLPVLNPELSIMVVGNRLFTPSYEKLINFLIEDKCDGGGKLPLPPSQDASWPSFSLLLHQIQQESFSAVLESF